MDITRLDADQVAARARLALGFYDAGTDLFSTEALAASLRRAASFLSPTTPGSLIRSVAEVLEGLPGDSTDLPGRLEDILDTLVGYGDLLELPVDTERGIGRRIVLGPPSFVRRASGSCLLIGTRPDGAPLVGEALASAIQYRGHSRFLPASPELDQLLAASDLAARSSSEWLKPPRQRTAIEVVTEYQDRLQAAGPSGQIEGARLLDPSAPVTYYRGRWRSPKARDSGTFVARRPQAFGAELWCFAELLDGQFVRLIDFPLFGSPYAAADEAWRLQAAIDALGGQPQQVRWGSGPDPAVDVLDFFSPLPSWAQRRLDIVGNPLERSRGALFSYGLPGTEAVEELDFLTAMLWVTAT